MATSNDELQCEWLARVQRGQFSNNVLGIGTIRVMGKAGDAPVAFPRIASLDLLPTLEPDEQWAVNQAQAIVQQAQQESRTVFDTSTGQVEGARRLTTFDPSVTTMMVVARIAGG